MPKRFGLALTFPAAWVRWATPLQPEYLPVHVPLKRYSSANVVALVAVLTVKPRATSEELTEEPSRDRGFSGCRCVQVGGESDKPSPRRRVLGGVSTLRVCGVGTQMGMDMPVAAEVPNSGKLSGQGLKDSLVTDWLIFTGLNVSKSTQRVT
ncbi:unnamed protein product [Phytophthora lilii]|uniref:Unnamed protein product n=1 Tax=Phytophthora lilii TaxID=2077276 RepID=A0A9W6U213_9STRA|nr:unnamed protein product [Phytophthora lilii]